MSFIKRQLILPLDQSFFLFGARNTGKSTLIHHRFSQKTLWIDLLDPISEMEYSQNPSLLEEQVNALDKTTTHIVIDEVQKIPRLLDTVHKLIETTEKKFVLTGSSARKLRHGGANLLAGRAFVYNLYPFTSFELGEHFDLNDALRFGTLPRISALNSDDDKMRFLQAYTQTYLKEEVWMEQFTRKMDPFRKFLETSAQVNGKIINVANIARDTGVSDKTAREYFSILEDTLIGFFLEPFQHSFRKRLSQKPKFYYFDPGVSRALTRQLSVPLTPSTSAYGDAFEHFIVLEAIKLADIFFPEYRFSYLKTKDDAEIDLVVERPGNKILFIEIKSGRNISELALQKQMQLAKDFGDCELVCFSQDTTPKRFKNVTIYPWKTGLEKFFIAKS